jgi:hypothetical protein
MGREDTVSGAWARLGRGLVAWGKKNGEPWRRSRLRQAEYLNNVVDARSPAGETSNRPGTWFWGLLDGPTNAGRLRGDGDDQERVGSERQRQRHRGPGRIHRWTVPGGRLRGHLILSRMTRDPRSMSATEPLWPPVRAASSRRLLRDLCQVQSQCSPSLFGAHRSYWRCDCRPNHRTRRHPH